MIFWKQAGLLANSTIIDIFYDDYIQKPDTVYLKHIFFLQMILKSFLKHIHT